VIISRWAPRYGSHKIHNMTARILYMRARNLNKPDFAVRLTGGIIELKSIFDHID